MARGCGVEGLGFRVQGQVQEVCSGFGFELLVGRGLSQQFWGVGSSYLGLRAMGLYLESLGLGTRFQRYEGQIGNMLRVRVRLP